MLGRDEQRARETAHWLWPNGALPGELAQILPTPRHFEQAAQLVTEHMLADEVICGPDLDRHAVALAAYEQAGFDELYVNQIGPRAGRLLHRLPRPHLAPRPRLIL